MSLGGPRLEAELARVGAEYEPPPDWQARVLAAIAPPPRRRHRWALVAAPTLAMAAAMLVWLRPAAEVVSRVEIVRSDDIRYRGAEGEHRWLSANLNDHLRAVASTNHAIRVYEGNDLLIACPGAATCRNTEGALELDARLSRTGEYTVLIFETPLDPASHTDLDSDKAAAIRAGKQMIEQQVRVQ